MKKFLCILLIMVPFVITGCGANNNQIVNRDYTTAATDPNTTAASETSEATDPNTTAAGETTETKENATSTEEVQTGEAGTSVNNDKFAYYIHDGIMDLDSVNGPYFIINLSTMEVLDCTSKGGKVVDYSRDGSKLTITLYSDEYPVKDTFVIDTNVTACGKLPVS